MTVRKKQLTPNRVSTSTAIAVGRGFIAPSRVIASVVRRAKRSHRLKMWAFASLPGSA